jgi:hypothetical protein
METGYEQKGKSSYSLRNNEKIGSLVEAEEIRRYLEKETTGKSVNKSKDAPA